MLTTVQSLSAITILGVLIQTIGSQDMKTTVESGSLDFALKLDKVLSTDTQNNIVFSPFSLSTALAMTLLGAHNKSGEELSNVLFGKTITAEEYESLAKEYQTLVDRCVKSNANVLSSANFMYSHKNYPILTQYKRMIETCFAANSQELDFEGENQKAIEVINADIKRATNGKIDKLFDELDFNTKMVLTNAIYFKGFWKSQFKTEMTTRREFKTNCEKAVDVEMMSQTSKFPFARSEGLKCSAIELGYEKSNTVLIVLLPEEDSSVEELKYKLNGQTLNQLLNDMFAVKVEVFLPKFKIESTLPLIPVLSRLGIKQIFDPKSANFSGITSDPLGLYIGDIIQKAVIEVNEEGTEAAAATGIAFMSRSLEFPERFEANRPFMFLLMSKYDSNKTTILFTGTVNNPNN